MGQGKYNVFVLLIFIPCLSNTTVHVSRSSSTSSRVIAHITRSSANIIAQGGSFSMFSVRTSIIIMNKRGLSPILDVIPPLLLLLFPHKTCNSLVCAIVIIAIRDQMHVWSHWTVREGHVGCLCTSLLIFWCLFYCAPCGIFLQPANRTITALFIRGKYCIQWGMDASNC